MLVLLLAVASASPLAAQVVAPDRSTITGIITDSISGKTLKDVTVYFTARAGDAQTNHEGRFTIVRRSADDTVLVVRTIGYVPAYLVIPFSASASVVDVGHVKIGPVATKLDRIAVEAEEVRLYPNLEDFYRRKQQGLAGQFITREEIEQSAVRKSSELLGRSAKVAVSCPHDAIRAGDENCMAVNRRGLIGGYRRLDGATTGCEMDLFVDGRLSTLGVDEVPVSQIAAVEIYSGPATTPANFGLRKCGVIAIWTTGTGTRTAR